jgi:hypothetical protein
MVAMMDDGLPASRPLCGRREQQRPGAVASLPSSQADPAHKARAAASVRSAIEASDNAPL